MKIEKELGNYSITGINEPSIIEIIKKRNWLKDYLREKENPEEQLVDIFKILVGITDDLELPEEEQENEFSKIDVTKYFKTKQYQVVFLGYDESERVDILSSYIYSLGTQQGQREIEELMLEANSEDSNSFVIGIYDDEEKANRISIEIDERGGYTMVTEIY